MIEGGGGFSLWPYTVGPVRMKGLHSQTERKIISVAYPGCLSRILILNHPGSRIPDPKTETKERETNLDQFSKNFLPKNCHYALKKPIPDPGSKGQKCTGSGSATRKIILWGPHSSSFWLPRNHSNHIYRQAPTSDTVIVWKLGVEMWRIRSKHCRGGWGRRG
jgi:hypothetical protein